MTIKLFTFILLTPIVAHTQTNTFPASGFTGIGTLTPSTHLEVVGGARVHNSMRIGAFVIAKGGDVYPFGVNQGIRVDDLSSASMRFQTSNSGHVVDNFVFENTFGMNRSLFSTNSSVVRIRQGWGNPNTHNYSVATLRIDNDIDVNTGFNMTIRGIYYNPTLTNISTVTHIAIENSSGTNRFNSSSGNTLIGTSTDNGNKLQVNGHIWSTGLTIPNGAVAGMVLTSDGSGNATWQPAGGGGGNYWPVLLPATVRQIGNTTNESLQVITNNTNRIHIAAGGNVGIGTTNVADANYKLFVEGSIRTRKVRIDQVAWPDYVFHPTYVLRPLREVERYIRDHNHLPEIPSAAQVAKEGIDVGNNQALLLKKIEELTLYIIQLEKRVDDLEAGKGKAR